MWYPIFFVHCRPVNTLEHVVLERSCGLNVQIWIYIGVTCLSIYLKNVEYICSPLCNESALMTCLLYDMFFNVNIF